MIAVTFQSGIGREEVDLLGCERLFGGMGGASRKQGEDQHGQTGERGGKVDKQAGHPEILPERDGRRAGAALPHVVILGGGFGGLAAAKALRRAPVRVTLVDRKNHHLFQPLLYQVATAGLAPGDISASIRQVFRRQKNLTVAMAEITGIDVVAKRVTLAAPERARIVLDYDFLKHSVHDDAGVHGIGALLEAPRDGVGLAAILQDLLGRIAARDYA